MASNGSLLKKSMDENRQHQGAHEDGDAAQGAAAPLFDDEATQVAQPVVPLTPAAAAVAASAPLVAAPREEVMTVVTSQTSRSRFRRADGAPFVSARRSWLLALIAISVLVGSVLGGVGLRLYQKRQATKTSATPAAQEIPQTPVVEEAAAPPLTEAAAATTAQAEDAQESVELPSETAPTIEEDRSRTPAGDATRREAGEDEDREARATRSQAVQSRQAGHQSAGAREEDDDRDRRERRDEREDERPRGGEVRARRVNDPESDYIEREARRIRRLERQRQRRERSVDSLRGIFEGRP